jgi:hypothetical protein
MTDADLNPSASTQGDRAILSANLAAIHELLWGSVAPQAALAIGNGQLRIDLKIKQDGAAPLDGIRSQAMSRHRHVGRNR